MDSGEIFLDLTDHEIGVEAVAYSPKDDILVSGDQNGFNIIWDTETNEQIRTLEEHAWVIKDIVFSPDGKIIATGDWGWGKGR